MYHLYTYTSDAWDAMLDATASAVHTIEGEFYAFEYDHIGATFAALWKEKARAGVSVRLHIDAFGSMGVSRSCIRELRSAGVHVFFFNGREHGFRSMWHRLVTRSHRKLYVIDETIGFIGGVNIADYMKDWPDFMLEVSDTKALKPIVATIRDHAHVYYSDVDIESYMVADGAVPLTKPKAPVQFFFDKHKTGRSLARDVYISLITDATKEVRFVTPYFFPDRSFLAALRAAHKRGVIIRMILPRETDLVVSSAASRTHIQRLLAAGVQLYFYPKMIHAKGMLVDNDELFLGSTNLDLTSFYDNMEADVLIRDPGVIAVAAKTFDVWEQASTRVDVVTWKQRGWCTKIMEGIALLLYSTWHFQSIRR
jgi:cardiolipin synthase